MLDSNSPLGEYLAFWLETYCENRLARNTVIGYRNNVRLHIVPHLGGVPIILLTPFMIDGLYSELRKKGLSETTILYVHSVLRKALNTAVRRRLLSENVVNCVDAPRKNRYQAKYLSPEQLKLLLDSCRYLEIYVPVLLAAVFGLRRGEVLGLTWDNVDFSSNQISVAMSGTYYRDCEFYLSDVKTESSRRCLLMPLVVSEALRDWHEIQERPCSYNLVVTHYDGSLFTANSLSNHFRKALREAGLPHVRFHDLRHSYATMMLQNNISPKIVCDILGHSSVDVTLDVYSHVVTEMQRPAANVIDGLFRRF